MISKRIRKIANRSGLQPCVICGNQEILVEHHIEGREIYNPNHISNLCYLCDNCHRKIHNGIINIEGWYTTTKGRELFWH